MTLHNKFIALHNTILLIFEWIFFSYLLGTIITIGAGMVVGLFSYGILDRITEEPYWSPWYTCWLIATGAWLLKTIIQREQRSNNLSEAGINPVITIH